MERDRRNQRELLAAGWRVAIVWECALRKQGNIRIAPKLDEWLRGDARQFETELQG